jgi:hypothetical protein
MKRLDIELIENGLDFLLDAYYPEDISIVSIEIQKIGTKKQAVFNFDKVPIVLASEKVVYWQLETEKSGTYTSDDFYELFDDLEYLLSESNDDDDDDDLDEDFEDWIDDGNVEEIEPGVFATQDAQWQNKIVGMDALKNYFIKEFR